MPSPEKASANRLDRRASFVYLALWGLLMFHGWGELASGNPTEQLHYPASTAGRLTGRALELAEAIESAPEPERRFWQRFEATPEDALSNAIAIHYDVLAAGGETVAADELEWSSGDIARVSLAVLLAEEGSWDEGCEVASGVSDIGDLCGLLRHLHGQAAAPANAPDIESLAAILDDWPADRLRVRSAQRADDPLEAERILRRVHERGQRWFAGSRAMFAANWGLIIAGGVVLLAWAWRSRVAVAEPIAQPGAPWSLADGLGVLVRADFFSRAFFIGLGELPEAIAYSAIGEFLYSGATVLAHLPMLWLVGRHLVVPNLGAHPDPLGLDLRRLSVRQLAACTLAASAALLLGTQAIGWGSWWMEVGSPWSEGFDETLVWGTNTELLLSSLDYVVWVPAFEELAFRGLLFFSLRKRLGVWGAALVSASLFSAVHFYSVTGFLSTLWSGVVWALVFERTHSLLPAVAAHGLYNALFVAGLLLLYR